MYTNAQLLGTMLAYAWVLSPKCTRVDSLMHHQGKNLRLSPTPLLPCPSGRTHMQRQMIVLQKVMKLPDLVDHLRGLADKGMALGPLLALLLPPLGTSIFDKKLYAKTALSMVKTLPLGQSYLQKAHLCLTHLFANDADYTDQVQALTQQGSSISSA